jgi:hypothetical protein
MTDTLEATRALAAAYTAAWNSGSPEAVASFCAQDGHLCAGARVTSTFGATL